MLPTPDPIPNDTLRRLHRQSIDDPPAVRNLLRRVLDCGAYLNAGISSRSVAKRARLVALAAGRMRLETVEISSAVGHQLALNFDLDGRRYFFVSRLLSAGEAGTVEVEIPSAVHLAENRDFHRACARDVRRAPTSVELWTTDGAIRGEVVDWTYHGMGVEVPAEAARTLTEWLRVHCLDGEEPGGEAYGQVRHREEAPGRPGWSRIGLSVSRVQPSTSVEIERYSVVPPAKQQNVSTPPPPVTKAVEFENDRGEPMRAILDTWGSSDATTCVVIPPPWGRTKETLLPLAATIVASFRSAGWPIAVMRFDGTRRRGESYVPPECRAEGLEHIEFTFSQAVEDTKAAIRFLRGAKGLRCGKAVLVSFSLAAVEGRRVVAEDCGRDLAGWVSTVGVADLASSLQVISGGVDYGYGLLRDLRFGRQELFGALVNIDRAGADAIDNGLAFLEHARRDMARISLPVTWIHGSNDAWVDLQRVHTLLSCGKSENRRLLEFPVGHQLRSSTEALGVFGVIAREVARMSLGRSLPPVAPDLRAVARQRDQERKRLSRPPLSQAIFWRDYLLGREERLGIGILTATDAYQDFMKRQAALLGLRRGERVVDLGSGTCDFSLHLAADHATPSGLEIHAVDFVVEALARGAERLRFRQANGRLRMLPVVANLDLIAPASAMPLAAGTYDAALASLLLGYVSDSDRLMREIHRILRPGGTVVVSSLRRDADISKIYVDSLAERYSDRPREAFGVRGERDVDRSLPGFLNAACRIIDLEERGRFRFFDPPELEQILRDSGFEEVKLARALGDPPQAVVARGRKPA